MTPNSDFSYLPIALKYIGTKEFAGSKHNPVIVGWLKKLKAWWADDEAAWCGVFAAICMKESAHEYPKMYMRALDWASWGRAISRPCVGAVAIKSRKGGGHVCIIVGRNANGQLLAVGGNQDNEVKISAFPADAFHAFRIPINADSSTLSIGFEKLPLMNIKGQILSEA